MSMRPYLAYLRAKYGELYELPRLRDGVSDGGGAALFSPGRRVTMRRRVTGGLMRARNASIAILLAAVVGGFLLASWNGGLAAPSPRSSPTSARVPCRSTSSS